MDVRPVLQASSQVLEAVEIREGDVPAGIGRLGAWQREGPRVPRVIVGTEGPPELAAIAAGLSEAGAGGGQLAIAIPESWLDAEGMREALAELRAAPGAQAIIADVASAEQRSALAAAGVTEVAGPGIAPFEEAERTGRMLTRLGIAVPAGPEPSRRAASAPAAEPVATAAPTAGEPVPTAGEAADAAVPTAGEAEPRRHAFDEPGRRNRLTDPQARMASAAQPPATKGSPGRSQPPRRASAGGSRRRPPARHPRPPLSARARRLRGADLAGLRGESSGGAGVSAIRCRTWIGVRALRNQTGEVIAKSNH